MEPLEELECTQVLHEETHANPQPQAQGSGKLKVACLTINSTKFPIFNGDTFIGRDPKRCAIVLNQKSVSSHHALIEVESGHHLICDLGSSNSTRLNGMLLKPHVRYNLSNYADVQIADIKGLYQFESSKPSDSDTSSDDIFATPAKSSQGSSCRRSSLNFSGDDSVIGSTPMRSDFKQPQPRTSSKSSVNDSDRVYREVTFHQSFPSTPDDSRKTDIYEAETQTTIDSDTSLFNDSVDNINCQDAISSFVVPCTQEQSASSSINLHYETDQNITNTFEDCENRNTSSVQDKISIDKRNESNRDCEYDAAELSDEEQKFIEEEMNRIERSMSTEMAEDTCKNVSETKEESKVKKCLETLPSQDGNNHRASTEIADIMTSNAKPVNESLSEACTEDPKETEKIQKTEIQMLDLPKSNCEEENKNKGTSGTSSGKSKSTEEIIHAAATQIVNTVASDSETDDEGVYGACTEIPKVKDTPASDSETDDEGVYGACTGIPRKMDNIHDAKTQILHLPETNCEEESKDKENPKSTLDKTKSKDETIHSAATQIINTAASESETDDEGVYGACTEIPRKIDIIHDAKTQILELPKGNVEDQSKDEETSDKSKSKQGTIHAAATQIVDTVASDSETDDEGVYGACTEITRKMNIIHDAKTQILDLPEENGEDQSKDEETSDKSKNKQETIHAAATQIVNTVASDSETDDEGIYGACAEVSKKTDNIHDAKTQMLNLPERNGEDQSEDEESSDKTKSENEAIHSAATQIVNTAASESETDDEGVYGACTEIPRKIDNIHDAKTQMLNLPERNGEDQSEDEESSDKTKSKQETIHAAATQIVDTVASDSETDHEGVDGACAEVSKKIDNIHDAKTQILDLPEENGEDQSKDEETSDKSKSKEDTIHAAATQIVDTVASDSETDDEGVYGACTEIPKVEDNIHDPKTQILHLPETNFEEESKDKENPKSTCDKTKSKEDTIHSAATQIINTAASASETDDEGVYGACTEIPRKMDNIHDAKTQILELPEGNGEDQSKDEETSDKSKSKQGTIHAAATQIVNTVASNSETDDEGVYGACTEILKVKDNIHDAKTQILDLPEENGENQSKDEETNDKSKNKQERIHAAATQIVDTVASDSETDDEGVYGACAEVSKKIDNIHDAETQMLNLPERNGEDQSEDEESSDKTKSENETIHSAATQIVNTAASESETDDEGVYGACTEIPRKMDIIYDAKTQILELPKGNVEDQSKDEETSDISKSKQETIHAAATQIVDTVASDSETDDEGVYGACTEILKVKDNIHDAKTKILDLPETSCEHKMRDKGISGLSSDKSKSKEDTIQAAVTQIVDTVALDSEGVYGACAEVPKKIDNIHDAETQMLDLPERNGDDQSKDDKILGSSSGKSKCKTEESTHRCTEIKPSSPRKRLSLSRTKKKVKQIVSSTCLVNGNAVTPNETHSCSLPEDDMFTAATQLLPPSETNNQSGAELNEVMDFCAAPTQVESSLQQEKLISNSKPDVEEKVFTASTQILKSPGQMVSVCEGQSEEEEDLFTAPTQILPISPHIKPVHSDLVDIFDAATQILCSPVCSNSVLVKKDVAVHNISPGLRECNDMSTAIPDDNEDEEEKKSSLSPEVRAKKREESDPNIKYSPNTPKPRKESRTRKTKLQPQRSKNFKLLRSSPPEVDIEDTSTESTKSVSDIIYDGHDKVDNTAAITSKVLQKQVSPPKKASVVLATLCADTHESTSSIISRSSGRKTLSLTRKNVSTQENLIKGNSKDLCVNDSQSTSTISSQQEPVPLITVQDKDTEIISSETVSEKVGNKKLPRRSVRNSQNLELHTESDGISSTVQIEDSGDIFLTNICEKVRNKKVHRRSVRNSHNIEDKTESDDVSSRNNCTAKEFRKCSDSTKSILKFKPEAGPSRKSVSFVPYEEVASSEKVDHSKDTEDNHTRDAVSHSETAKTNKNIKTKGCYNSKPGTTIKNSDSQSSGMSKEFIEAETSDLTQPEERRPIRGRKQAVKVESKDCKEISNDTVDFAKPKPAQRTSKRKAETVLLLEESSHPSSQTSNSSQESCTSDIGTRRSTRARKQKISESSEDGSIPEPPTKRQTKSKKTVDAVDSSLASSSESLTSLPDTFPQVATRKSNRSRKLPSKLVEGTSLAVKEQEQSSSRTRSRKGAQRHTGEEESVGKRDSSVDSVTNTREGRCSSNKKPASSSEEETKVTGVKRLPSKSSDKDCDAVPSKISRQSYNLPPVLENSSENSVLDTSLPLKREGEFNESFASDIGLEPKRPKGRRLSAVSTSTSPRRSPRPRQSMRGTSSNMTRVLFSFLNNPRHENLVKQLGGVIVDSVDSADVLVTDKLRRTVKLLCFLGRGLPIVGTPWLTRSKAAGRLLDPWEHILTDDESELKYSVNLKESLKKSCQNPILQGYHVYVTKNVKPIPAEIKAIVTSSGGVILSRAPSVWPSNSIAISCPEDKTTWTKLQKKIPVVSSEWLLQGVLRQCLNVEVHCLK